MSKIVGFPSSLDGSSCYFIESFDDIASIEDQISALFHQNYFRIDGAPLIVIKDKTLHAELKKIISKYKFEEVELVIHGEDAKNIHWAKEPKDLSSFMNSEQLGEKYFISTDDSIFSAWINSMGENELRSISTIYSLRCALKRKEKDYTELEDELKLVRDSLGAVKAEYSKELNWYKNDILWYKKEIENIKNWYQAEYGKTPALIHKIFKKLL